MHNGGMTTPEEFRTIRITPASAAKRGRLARRRNAELEQIRADGWTIVDIEPERIFRPGDKVTVSRAARPTEPALLKKQEPAFVFEGKWAVAAVVAAALLLSLIVLDAVL